jgi:hypothetical protein
VTIAKQTGGLNQVYPEGCTVETVPHDLHSAFDHALRILSWQENLPSDEMPPRWMWPLDWEIDQHFKVVDARRKEKYGGNTSDSTDYGDEDVSWEENVYSARFKD